MCPCFWPCYWLVCRRGSIRNNLLLGRDAISERELTEAIRLAAANFVFDLPQELDTRVGDGGVLLSGGERQRIALARAFLMKPKLLILDAAISARSWPE